jgi:Tfp pilus assembly protein PilF/O-antigen ligase
MFIAVLIFSPLAFGTVERWSYAVMEIVSVVVLLLVFLRIFQKKKSYYETPGIVPLLMFLAYILLQAVPVPPQFIKILSPATYEIYKQTLLVADPSAWIPLSLNPKATLKEFFRFSAYAAFYIVTVQLLTRKEFFKRTVFIIAICASFISFFGIIQHLISNNKIYWFRELTQGGVPFGPYVNRNHYAGFMEMLFPIVIGLFLFYKPHVSYTSLREKIAELFNLEKTNIYLLLGFSAILIGTSVFLSLSRSGIISLSVSMVFFGFMLLVHDIHRKRAMIIIIVCTLIALSVGWFGWGPIIDRFKELYPVEGDISEFRPIIWNDSRQLVKDFFLTGSGFGSYVSIYPLYKTLTTKLVVDHAHNDYIELLSNGGIIAFLLGTWFVASVVIKSFRVYTKRHELLSLYLFIGSMTGILSLLIHSFTDFNLYIGANGLYFFFLLGLIVSASHTRLREGLHRTYLKRIRISGGAPFAMTVVLSLSTIIFNIGLLLGKSYYPGERIAQSSVGITNEELKEYKKRIVKASLLDPFEPTYHASLAGTERELGNHDAALRQYQKALRMNPLNGEYIQKVGLGLSDRKERAADTLLRSGITYDRNTPQRYKVYALWVLSHGRKKDAISIVREAVALDPRETREYITLMVLHGVHDEEIPEFLPERADPYLVFATYLQAIGKDGMAEDAYQKALKYAAQEPVINSSHFSTIARYYIERKNYDQALGVMRRAIELLPEDVKIHVQAARLYEKLGIRYRAIEEYRDALIIDPDNKNVKQRLELLEGTSGS